MLGSETLPFMKPNKGVMWKAIIMEITLIKGVVQMTEVLRPEFLFAHVFRVRLQDEGRISNFVKKPLPGCPVRVHCFSPV